MALPPLSPIKLQGLNPSYLIATKDGKPDPNFIIQFNTLIKNIVDQVNAIIIAYNAAQGAQSVAQVALAQAAQVDFRSQMGDPLPYPVLGGPSRSDLLPPVFGERSLALPVALTVGASPYSFQAPSAGTVVVNGGTVTGLDFTRDGATLIAFPSGVVPVSAGDTVIVTYAVLPTMTFIEG